MDHSHRSTSPRRELGVRRLERLARALALAVAVVTALPGQARAELPGDWQPPGFHVRGREILDRLGEPVLLRGVNKMNVWMDRDGSESFPEIRRTGANIVRIVWVMNGGDWIPTAADLDRVIANALANQLIPMVELHDATGQWNRLQALVDYWKRADILAVIEKYEHVLLVNIGNEVGDASVTADRFLAGYRSAVTQLRDAGIETPLVIDAPDWGKNLGILTQTASALLEHDPQHNLIFSAHLYWPRRFGADAAFIRTHLQAAADAGYALVIGEFSRYGAYAGGASICSPNGETDYAAILAECDRLAIGWYAWEWGPGNTGGGDPLCEAMDMTSDGTFAGLKEGWAMEVAWTSPYGIQATSVTPRSMLEDGDPDPRLCGDDLAGVACRLGLLTEAGFCAGGDLGVTLETEVELRVARARRLVQRALEAGDENTQSLLAQRAVRQLRRAVVALRDAGEGEDPSACVLTLVDDLSELRATLRGLAG